MDWRVKRGNESRLPIRASGKCNNVKKSIARFATRYDKILIAIALLASVIAGIMIPYSITLVANTFMNMVAYAYAKHTGKQDATQFLGQMHNFGIHFSCIGVILCLGGYLGSALMSLSAVNQVYKIRQAYLRAALNQDFTYFDLRETGDFASRMAEDVIKVEEGISDKASVLVNELAIIIGCVSMALYKGWKLALICVATAPVSFVLVGITGTLATRFTKKEATVSARASAVAQEALGSIRTVYAFNGQEKEMQRYEDPLAEARKISIKRDFFMGLSTAFLAFCTFGSYALNFYVGIYLVINEPQNYNADTMFSVMIGVMTGLGHLPILGASLGSFGVAKGAGAQIFHLLNNVPTMNPLLDRGLKPETVEGNIELKNVVFHYPSRPSVPVLKKVSLSVRRGQSIALVGHSGCGKSTVLQLVSRYYDVIDGSVSLDGHDVRELSVAWLRARIGLVGQEPALFNTTVRENIRHGRDDATDEEVEAAAKLANAQSFIKKLPKGYDTLVGEHGASISGGQKQRIAIARALVRNPLILLLDEATSALDTSSEAKVQKALEKAAEGRTTITVAHRLSTIRNVDVIYVMKEGQVVEYGAHGELMGRRGQYYDMVVTQEPALANSKEEQPLNRQVSITSEEVVDKADVTSIIEDEGLKDQELSFWQVVRLNSPEWKCIAVGSIGSIFFGFSMPLFVNEFGQVFGSMSDADPNKAMEKVKKVAGVCVGLGLVMAIASLITGLSFGIAGACLTERLRVRMFAHMLRQHIGFFDDRANSVGALCVRLSADAAYVQAATGTRIGILLQGVGAIGLAIVLAMAHEWRVALVIMAFIPVVALVIYRQAKETGVESRGTTKSLENSTKIAVEAVSNIRTVAALGREKLFISEYMAQLQPALPLSRRSAHCKGLVTGMSRSMFNFINAAALTYGGNLIVSDGVAYNDILVTTQALQMASAQVENAFTFAPEFQKGIIAATRIVGQLKQKPKIVDLEKPAIIGFESKGEANFKDVEFCYPTRPNIQVLRGLNFKVECGKTVALVGQSGCGKSTVIQLLQRFYDPDAGIIYLDKYPIPSLLIHEVRSTFGLVSQEPVLFDRSIKENIAYGDNSRDPSMHDIIDAAKQSNIHDFIASLPEGYETNIGSKGVQLSGGQKQRVAIARALMRKPKILLLDEATSALDSESEKVVLGALEAARAGRTCVVIAHRLSTVRDADVIHVLDSGSAVESGTHQQLLQQKGIYAKLYAPFGSL